MRSIICVFVNENNKFLHTVFKKSVIKTSDRVRIVLGTHDISTCTVQSNDDITKSELIVRLATEAT